MASIPTIAIRGDGVAAYCCAHLLSKAGVPISLEPVRRPRVPALLISFQALALIRDIFNAPGLLESLPVITRRRVSWERGQQAADVGHRAVVVSEQLLLESLAEQLPARPAQPIHNAAWTIYAAPPLPVSAQMATFGSRMATSWRVQLCRESRISDACIMESAPKGWLFLLPAEPGYGWLLAVGDPGPDPLATSKLIRREVLWLLEQSQPFAISPRIAPTMGGQGWLACGTAAMSFDPICGDGVAHAVREAILATALVRAALSGEPVSLLIEHYEARMRAGFARHLELVKAFYANGYGGSWWNHQVPVAPAPPQPKSFHYRLRGLDLESIGQSAHNREGWPDQ
jgi:hypothetical protein